MPARTDAALLGHWPCIPVRSAAGFHGLGQHERLAIVEALAVREDLRGALWPAGASGLLCSAEDIAQASGVEARPACPFEAAEQKNLQTTADATY